MEVPAEFSSGREERLDANVQPSAGQLATEQALTMKEIGFAVVGLGVGEQHARCYAALPDCHLRWLHDLDTKKAEKLAFALVTDAVATCYEQILESSTSMRQLSQLWGASNLVYVCQKHQTLDRNAKLQGSPRCHST
jgi:hypothetical protein